MTLEQRIEALENAVANLNLPNNKTEELAKMMRDTSIEVIKNSCRPGGILHSHGEKAAVLPTALFKVEHGSVNIRLAKINASVPE